MGLLNIRQQERPRLNRFSVLFFGDSGVGKTGESAKFPQALILDCEGNTDFLSGVAIQEVASAGQFLPLAREIAAGLLDGELDFRTVVVDGFTSMVKRAARTRTAEKSGQRYDTRRIYRDLTNQITQGLSLLMGAGVIVVATGHARIDDTDDPNTVIVRPDLNEVLADDVVGMFNIVLFCHRDVSGPRMVTKPIVEKAGRNTKRHIMAKDHSGKLPTRMPLDASQLLQTLKNGATNGN